MQKSIINKKDIMETLEKYNIARNPYLPSIEEGEVDALIVAVKPLPNQIQVGGQNVQITNAEEMNEEPKQLFKELSIIWTTTAQRE